ncbi:sigma-70 family RNA polymerase sigma factor [Leptolyngbya ohadii]|uniref:sigma-70 family RNA polymerase sigma factor n=1 Tax=Leptolyngbya ohadii TaxID=1962290 RepID=UPI000B59A87A|nr:sigma-70 family RNA polymerase sigma factor [Leptolyngbya ohadii]
MPYDLENPDLTLESPELTTLKAFLRRLLKQYKLNQSYQPHDIFDVIRARMLMQLEEQASPGSRAEIEMALLKTTGLEIIKELDEARTANKQKFIEAVQPLFDDNDLAARSFHANVARLLRQFRLYTTYEVREIIAEAYIRGIKRIESGKLIDNPRAWLRSTCLNVIRDLRRKQDKEEKPKIDPTTLWGSGETSLSQLIVREDLRALALAFQKLTPKEQQLLYAKYCEGLTWERITEIVSESTGTDIPCGTVRQQGSRALKRLFKHYSLIRESLKMDNEDTSANL